MILRAYCHRNPGDLLHNKKYFESLLTKLLQTKQENITISPDILEQHFCEEEEV